MSLIHKASVPVESMGQGKTADERLTVIAVRVDQTMRVVEALAGLALCVISTARDEGEVLPEPVLASAQRLAAVLGDDR